MAAGDTMRRIASRLDDRQRARVLYLDKHRQQWQRGASVNEELLELKIVEKVASLTDARKQSARLTALGRNIAAFLRTSAEIATQDSECEAVGEGLEIDGGPGERVL
jgi:hypothetical protein